MSILHKATEDKEFDIRITQRKLSKGLILQDDLDKHIKKITDDVANADYVSLDLLMEQALHLSNAKAITRV